MRIMITLSSLALVLLATAGCTSATPTSARPPGAAVSTSAPAGVDAGAAPAWTEPAKYRFILDRQCSIGPSGGRYQVVVEGGSVRSADRIDGQTAAGEEEIDVPTLRQLAQLAQTATDDGASVTTSFDRTDGHPMTVTIDMSDGTDPSCFVISDYRTN